MTQGSEAAALRHAVDEVGYLHRQFSVEIDGARPEDDAATDAQTLVVRNELTKVERRYRRGRQQAWLGEFRRDLTAGAFN